MIEADKGDGCLWIHFCGESVDSFYDLIESLAQETYDTESVILARRIWRQIHD